MSKQMDGFILSGVELDLPIFMAGWAIDGRSSSKDDLAEMVDNTNQLIGDGLVPPVNYGHKFFFDPEEPQRGFLRSVRVGDHKTPKGDSVSAVFAEVFLHAETFEDYKKGLYPKVSAEIVLEAFRFNGEKLGLTISGLALLGSSPPAFPALFDGNYEAAMPMVFSSMQEWGKPREGELSAEADEGLFVIEAFKNAAKKAADSVSRLVSNFTNSHKNHNSEGEKMALSDAEMADIANGLSDAAKSLTGYAEKMRGDKDKDKNNKDDNDKDKDKDKDKDSPDGPSMKEGGSHSAEFEAYRKEMDERLSKLEEENKILKAEKEKTPEGAKKAADEVFDALHKEGKVIAGDRAAFDTLVEKFGLEQARATFAGASGKEPVNANDKAVNGDKPNNEFSGKLSDLGELTETEKVLIKTHQANSFDEDTIFKLIEGKRKHAALRSENRFAQASG